MPTVVPPSIRDPQDEYQRDNRRAVSELAALPLNQGVLLTDVALTTAVTRVRHNLGRTPIGFLVIDRTADARVYRSGAATPQHLPLIASVAATVSLWIF